jgi:hypothetical protein
MQLASQTSELPFPPDRPRILKEAVGGQLGRLRGVKPNDLCEPNRRCDRQTGRVTVRG